MSKWLIVVLSVAWLAWELVAAFDGSSATWPLTQIITTHVPWWVGLPAVAALAVWLIAHFWRGYRRSGEVMPGWVIGAVRAGVQFAWASAAHTALRYGWSLPADAPLLLDEAVLGAVLAVFVGLVQWLERRDASSRLGRLGRGVAKLLMLGARPAVYPRWPGEAPATSKQPS